MYTACSHIIIYARGIICIIKGQLRNKWMLFAVVKCMFVFCDLLLHTCEFMVNLIDYRFIMVMQWLLFLLHCIISCVKYYRILRLLPINFAFTRLLDNCIKFTIFFMWVGTEKSRIEILAMTIGGVH